MKTILNILVLTFLLVAASSPCFADFSIEQVSRERAKALGMEIQAKANGPNAVWVELEFKPEGKLEDFSHVSLEIGEGEKSLVSASLREDRSKPGCVAVNFTADRANLDKIALCVMVDDMIPGGTIYELRVKDFVDLPADTPRLVHTGLWPTNWPKELEPLRKQSRTYRDSELNLIFYEIPFTNREEFESAWPHILKVKSKGAPLIVFRGPDTRLGTRINAGVRIQSPLPETGKRVTPSAPSDTTKDRELREWARTEIQLIMDGDIVVYNRLSLPADCPIEDQNLSGPELAGTVRIQLVDSEGKAVAFPQEGAAYVFMQDAIKKGTRFWWGGSAVAVSKDGTCEFKSVTPGKYLASSRLVAAPEGPTIDPQQAILIEVKVGQLTEGRVVYRSK